MSHRLSATAAKILQRRQRLHLCVLYRQTRPPTIDGVIKTRSENAKEFSRFLSSVNMVTCNPWYLWEKGFTKLWTQGPDGSKVEARGDYDEPRVHMVTYESLPTGIRNRIDVADRLEWMCHPLSGYLLKVFMDAFELGRVWGGIVERTRKPNAGYFYKHGFGLRPKFPDLESIALISQSAELFWGIKKTTPPEALSRGNPPEALKIQPDEEGYAEAKDKYDDRLKEYNALSQKYYEDIYIKQDFDSLLEIMLELFSTDVFAHIRKHKDNEDERRKYYVHFPSRGETFFDSPLAIKFDPQLIYRRCKKSSFEPKSKFVSRAYKELAGYCTFLETEFARQHSAMDFDSYDDLLRSINVAESLESIPPVMFEVLGTVLDSVPERSTARVYRTPRTEGSGISHPAGRTTRSTARGLCSRVTMIEPSLSEMTKVLRWSQSRSKKPSMIKNLTMSMTWKMKRFRRQAHPPVR